MPTLARQEVIAPGASCRRLPTAALRTPAEMIADFPHYARVHPWASDPKSQHGFPKKQRYSWIKNQRSLFVSRALPCILRRKTIN